MNVQRNNKRSKAYSALLLILFVCLTFTRGIEVRPCSNGQHRPAIVHIEGCSQMPCDFRRGTNTTMTMVYEAPFDAESLRYDRIFEAMGVIVPYPLTPERENGCNLLMGSSCPIRQRDLVISTHVSNTLSIIPLTTASVEFIIFNEQNHTMLCFEYDVRIVPS